MAKNFFFWINNPREANKCVSTTEVLPLRTLDISVFGGNYRSTRNDQSARKVFDISSHLVRSKKMVRLKN
jgi:hypothetical protein